MIEIDLFIMLLFGLAFCMFFEACMKSVSRKRAEEYVIIEGLRCLLSIELSEQFKKDKQIMDARKKYIRSTIKLLDFVNDKTRDQSDDTPKKAGKK